MKAERFKQVDQILQATLDRDPFEREAFLDESCGGDTILRGEVEALIAYDEKTSSFIERPAFEVAAEMMAGEQSEIVAGQAIGPYQIASRLGSGGMGDVYLAHDSRLGRKVALKILPDYFTHDTERLQRFKQEARSASALNHPNILTIYEIGQVDRIHFIATEFIDGEKLRQPMTSTQMNLGEVLDITTQVAAALAAAHGAGIVHRDIKPENIMLRRDGYVKVLDFGLAKLTERHESTVDLQAATRPAVMTDPGTVMGTVSYMAPEQARGLAVDGRTDIWSLGVVLYEMISGSVPFEGATPSDVLVSVLTAEPLPLAQHKNDVPVKLEQVVTKALRKESKDRYQTAGQLLEDLKRLNKELVLASQMGRSAPPDSNQQGTATKREPVDTDKQIWTRIGFLKTARLIGRTSYLYVNFADQRLRATIALATIILATVAIAFGVYKFSERNSSVNKNNEFQSEMVAIPGGTFQMGRDEGKVAERPAHSVTVSSFYVDRTETTNAEYAVFVRETKYPAPAHWSGITPQAGQEKWPVVNVSKDDADVYAAWRSKRDGVSYRLPTEEEWEYAARNGSLNTLYPWGNFVIEVKHHSFEPVGSHLDRATARGVYDMIGNAWEWTSSKVSPYPGNKISGNSEFRDWVIYRGGSYRSEMQGDDAKTASSRDGLPASKRSPVIGFRLVRSGP